MNKQEQLIVNAAIKTNKSLSLLLKKPNDGKLLDDYFIAFGDLKSLMFEYDYHNAINVQLDFNPDVVKTGLDVSCHYLIDSIMSEDYHNKKHIEKLKLLSVKNRLRMLNNYY